mgnify:CR=1 FL=1
MTADAEYKRIESLMEKHNVSIYAIAKETRKSEGSIKYSLKNKVDKIGTISILLGAIQKIINDKNKK